MNQKILITGAAGFLGSHLCQALHRFGYSIVALDNLSQGSRDNLTDLFGQERFEFIQADVRDRQAVSDAAQAAQAILHCASYKIPRYGHAEETLSVNLEGTEAVLEAARQHGSRVIYGSTEDVYGKNLEIPLSEEGTLMLGSPTSSRWSDAVSKICAEQLCYAYSEAYGVRFTILRYGNIYGPKNRRDWWGGLPAVFIDKALRREKMPIHGDGTQSRAFLFIEDAVDLTLKALESELVLEEVINVGSEELVRVINLAYLIWRLVENPGKPELEFIPYEDLSPNYEDVRTRQMDMSKARFLLDFAPCYNLKTGLAHTIKQMQGK
jgi:UDP-glucose 4-epimerase